MRRAGGRKHKRAKRKGLRASLCCSMAMGASCPPPIFQTWFQSREKATECSTQTHEETRSYINATQPTCLNTHIALKPLHLHRPHTLAHTHPGAMTQRGAAGTKALVLAVSSSPSGLVHVFLALQPAALISSQQQCRVLVFDLKCFAKNGSENRLIHEQHENTIFGT